MKIDLSKTVTTLNGVDITVDPSSTKALTLKEVCINALLTEHQDEKLSGQQKFERYTLAKKINATDEVELTPEEVVLIKDLVARIYTALVIGALYDVTG